MITITLVKKVDLNGEPCAKSAQVFTDLAARKLLQYINYIAIANELDAASEGYLLAAKYHIDAAPFFIVIDDDVTQIYTIYNRFLQDVFNQESIEIYPLR